VRAIQRKAQKVDRLRTFTPVLARVPLCKATKFNQFGLDRSRGQAELAQSFAQHLLSTLRRVGCPKPRKTRFRMAGQPCSGGTDYPLGPNERFGIFHPPFSGFAGRTQTIGKMTLHEIRNWQLMLELAMAAGARLEAFGTC
jgi:hypothetical protein